jgi:hypothetical protein
LIWVYNLKSLNEIEGREEYQALKENLDDDVDINRAWETITENIKIPVKRSLDY